MSSYGFYDAGALRQIATNLFYGWGYNFYRVENQLRADDQLVRSKAASLLGIAMASVEDGRERVPPRIPPRTLALQAISRRGRGRSSPAPGKASPRDRRSRSFDSTAAGS